MGLESVEIVMEVEDEFDIKISDDEASRIQRVGELVDCIRAKIGAVNVRGCHTAKNFYSLRRVITELAAPPRRSVRPSTRLETVISHPDRERVWQALKDVGLALPPLRRPETVVTVATALAILSTVAAAAVTRLLVPTDAALLSAVAYGGLAWYVALRLTQPWATCIPATCARVSDAVVWMTSSRSAETGEVQLSREEIAHKVRLIIAEIAGLPFERVTEDKSFTGDLHIG